MLKILILKRQLDAKRSELKALEEKDAEFKTREAELETAIGEVEPGNADIVETDDMIAEYLCSQRSLLCNRDIACPSGGDNDRAVSGIMLGAVYDADF